MYEHNMKMPIIEVKNLKKSYRSKKGSFFAVDGISFSVEEGDIFAFLGPNGAGKSTTIKMLTTLLEPTEGKIKINKVDPSLNEDEARRSFGIVFQDPSLDDDLTARENMQYHAVLYGIESSTAISKIEKLLRFVELWERRDDLVKDFSGGMKRRLEIARGLMHNPKILFLDEPTLGLDPQTRNHVWSYLREINHKEGMTIFFTTHYMEEAEGIAKNVAIVDHGKIIVQGSVKEVKRKYKKETLEGAFLEATGHKIREEQQTSATRMRMGARVWGRRG